MTSAINISTLTQSLEKRFKVMGIDKAREHADKLVVKLRDVTSAWKDTIYAALTKPASSRGLYRNGSSWLALHNMHSQNKSFPMLVSGLLRASIYSRVSLRNTTIGAEITVSRGFKNLGTGEVAGHRDYGDFLNEEHSLLNGWKERAYAILDKRIRSLTRIRNE